MRRRSNGANSFRSRQSADMLRYSIIRRGGIFSSPFRPTLRENPSVGGRERAHAHERRKRDILHVLGARRSRARLIDSRQTGGERQRKAEIRSIEMRSSSERCRELQSSPPCARGWWMCSPSASVLRLARAIRRATYL